MKRLFFLLSGLIVSMAFANPYTITKFQGDDVGSPDDYISAEFGGTLKISSSGTVENVQEGRFFVRQKFEDPFGEEPTTYQLYEGREGPSKSQLSAFSVPAGISYNDVVKAKCYRDRNDADDADVEKVYFDGTSVYVTDASSLFVNINSEMVELEPASESVAAPAAPDLYGTDSSDSEEDTATFAEPKPVVAPALAMNDSADDSDEYEYCDDNDPDCGDEDDSSYDVEGNVAETTAAADATDYSAEDAANDVTERFGIADEVRRWSAWGLVAVAAGSAVMGVLQHMEYNKAKDAYDDMDDLISQHEDKIAATCGDDASCTAALEYYYSTTPGEDLYELKQKKKQDKNTMDSYSMSRNIWFGVTAASLTGSIVLFTW